MLTIWTSISNSSSSYGVASVTLLSSQARGSSGCAAITSRKKCSSTVTPKRRVLLKTRSMQRWSRWQKRVRGRKRGRSQQSRLRNQIRTCKKSLMINKRKRCEIRKKLCSIDGPTALLFLTSRAVIECHDCYQSQTSWFWRSVTMLDDRNRPKTRKVKSFRAQTEWSSTWRTWWRLMWGPSTRSATRTDSWA